MKTCQFLFCSVLILSCMGTTSMPGADLASIPSKPAGGVLRVHPGNSRYFTDDSGKAIYMTGSHVWWNIVAKGGRNLPYSDDDYEAFLDYLESFDHNFTRIWIGFAYPGYSAYSR